MQGRQLVLELIDPGLETVHVGLPECRLRHPSRNRHRRVGKPPAEREQVALHRSCHLGHVGIDLRRQHQPERGVELIDRSAGFHARVRLRDAAAIEQPRVTVIARSGVDLHVGGLCDNAATVSRAKADGRTGSAGEAGSGIGVDG